MAQNLNYGKEIRSLVMKGLTMVQGLGMFLIVTGIALMIFSGFRFFTPKKVAEVGTLQVTREEPHSISWSPYIGVAAVVIGGVMFLVAAKKTPA